MTAYVSYRDYKITNWHIARSQSVSWKRHFMNEQYTEDDRYMREVFIWVYEESECYLHALVLKTNQTSTL